MTMRHRRRLLAAAILCVATTVTTPPVQAAAEPFIGELMWVGFNFCPRGWAAANGQLLPISSNTALFSLLGTTYGGDGQTTFALPDLRGRVMVHVGAGAGLSTIVQGEQGGAESRSLTFAQMPAHSHSATTTISDLAITSTLYGSSSGASSTAPAGGSLAVTKKQAAVYGAGVPNQAMAAGSVQSTLTNGTATTTVAATNSGTTPVPVRDPYLGLMACIALQGIYPSRD